MAETIYDLNNKITNKGATAQGRLSSDEFNLLVSECINTTGVLLYEAGEYNMDGTPKTT